MAHTSPHAPTAAAVLSARLLAAALMVMPAVGLDGQAPSSPVEQAHTALRAAEVLRASGTREALQQAAVQLDHAATLFAAAGDDEAAADSLITLGDVRQRLGQVQPAIDAYSRAAQLARRAADGRLEARALTGTGSALGRLSDYRKAIASFENAQRLFSQLGDAAGEADALAGIGAALIRLNEYESARDVLARSLPLYQSLGDRGGEAAALQSLGSASFSQDDYSAAISSYEQALDLARAAGRRSLEATIVYGLGQTYYHLGDYQHALDLYTQALDVHRALANRSGEAAALSAIGRVYRFMGEYTRALDHHGRALTILRDIGERMNEATSLNNSGHVYLSMGEYRKALPFFEASLEICRQVGNQSGIASNTNGIGLVHAGLQEYDQALVRHREALAIFRQIGHRRAEADSLGHIGRASHAVGEFAQARTHLRDALAIYRAVGVPRQESETLYAIARADRALGDLAAAHEHIDLALRLTEGFRQDVVSQRLRTSYQATVRDFYELKIDVLMARHQASPSTGFAAQAFETSERARARSLLDVLGEARAGIRHDLDPALAERERSLRRRLTGLAARQNEGGATVNATQVDALSREVAETIAAYDEVLATMRRQSPRYAALMQPEPLTLAEVRTEVLDPETVLLEYFLGAERSHVWAVSSDAVAVYELPRRAIIEGVARRLHELLAANAPRAEVDPVTERVSDLILAPTASEIAGKRLAIVADGALHALPFAALPAPRTATSDANSREPLIVRHEIVHLPSASTLAILRRETVARIPPPNLVAVVADPVFDASDTRVRQASRARTSDAAQAAESPALQRSAREVGLARGAWPPPRLLGTRREARAILSLAPASRRREALGFEASRETATSADLASYRIIHFATHALINDRQPELSGLVLSLVGPDGQSRDGFLRLTDIYNLRLPADLIVLSACQTGLGQDVRGEGLIGLTRGFMYAGAPRLIASLWAVDDRATSELMERFYRGLLGRGLTAAEALRQAQIDMWQQKDWQSPAFWAAFAIQGDWRPTSPAAASRQ
jgi:CHAT domain-containing protein